MLVKSIRYPYFGWIVEDGDDGKLRGSVRLVLHDVKTALVSRVRSDDEGDMDGHLKLRPPPSFFLTVTSTPIHEPRHTFQQGERQETKPNKTTFMTVRRLLVDRELAFDQQILASPGTRKTIQPRPLDCPQYRRR